MENNTIHYFPILDTTAFRVAWSVSLWVIGKLGVVASYGTSLLWYVCTGVSQKVYIYLLHLNTKLDAMSMSLELFCPESVVRESVMKPRSHFKKNWPFSRD